MLRLDYPLPELDCDDCAAELHRRLMNEPGVHSVAVDTRASTVSVEVDEGTVAPEQLRTRISVLLGGEAQAAVHHGRRSGASPGAGEGAVAAGSPAIAPSRGDAPANVVLPMPLPVIAESPGVPAPRSAGQAVPAEPGHDDHAAHGHDHAGHDHDHAGHDHGHAGHDHSHDLHEVARTNRRKLLLALALGTSVLLAEIFVGLLANSLALLADAAHAITDQASVALALVAVAWGMRAATRHKTFGFRRGEVIAAFVNALALWAVSVFFIYEAVKRLADPPEVRGNLVILMGGITLVANLAAAKVLHGGSGHNLNMRAAFLHVLSDALGSAAALVAGLLVRYKGWTIADPLLTLFITALILVFTYRLTRQTFHILMEGSPPHADPRDVMNAMKTIPGVQDVHDLHVWTLTSGMDSVSAHVVTEQPEPSDRVVHAVQDVLKARFKIDHVTVQVEDPSCPCTGARHQWHAT